MRYNNHVQINRFSFPFDVVPRHCILHAWASGNVSKFFSLYTFLTSNEFFF